MPQVVCITRQFTLTRICWYTGSAADGVGELESLQDNVRGVPAAGTAVVLAGACLVRALQCCRQGHAWCGHCGGAGRGVPAAGTAGLTEHREDPRGGGEPPPVGQVDHTVYPQEVVTVVHWPIHQLEGRVAPVINSAILTLQQSSTSCITGSGKSSCYSIHVEYAALCKQHTSCVHTCGSGTRTLVPLLSVRTFGSDCWKKEVALLHT